MREYIINTNVAVIKKHLKKRGKVISSLNKKSIKEEYREWHDDSLLKTELIWTLPDLTQIERFQNFCRSIKKEIR